MINMILGVKSVIEDEIIAIAQKYNIEKVILFGSRARGDYHRTSDIDLAVMGGNYAAFCLAVDEETSTLLKYDFVNLGASVQPELLDAIRNEGKVIYDSSCLGN